MNLRIRMNMKINALLLGALSVLTAACSSDSPGEPADDALLKSFVLTIGELNYHADIDPDDHTARIGEIQYGGQISGVDYRLAEGATIAPDPKSLVGEWPESQEFAVSKEGRSENYTVYLSAYVAKWPEAENEIIFYDDFDQADGLDYDSWSHVPYGTAAWQIYMSGSPDQAYVKDGKLILTIEKKDGKVVSGGIKTQGKKWFNNCRIEVCARFVEDAGSIGQAIWLMPEPAYQIYPGWPHGGEIDIMEHSYLNDYVQQTLHSHYIDIHQETPSGKAAYAGYNKGTFNVYSADLTDEEIVFYTNDKETMRYANQHLPNESELMQWPFRGQYYLILSIGAAGRSEVQDADIPSFMEVDWVRVTRLGN